MTLFVHVVLLLIFQHDLQSFIIPPLDSEEEIMKIKIFSTNIAFLQTLLTTFDIPLCRIRLQPLSVQKRRQKANPD
jgi:hypothetical protein